MSDFNEKLAEALKAHDIFEAQEKISNAFSTIEEFILELDDRLRRLEEEKDGD